MMRLAQREAEPEISSRRLRVELDGAPDVANGQLRAAAENSRLVIIADAARQVGLGGPGIERDGLFDRLLRALAVAHAEQNAGVYHLAAKSAQQAMIFGGIRLESDVALGGGEAGLRCVLGGALIAQFQRDFGQI